MQKPASKQGGAASERQRNEELKSVPEEDQTFEGTDQYNVQQMAESIDEQEDPFAIYARNIQ